MKIYSALNTNYSSIIGGISNKLSFSSSTSSIIGGYQNILSGNSYFSSIIAGSGNIISESNRSVIIGGAGLCLNSQNDTVLVPNLKINNGIFAGNLPTSDPHVAGQWWSNGGIVTISAG